MIDCGQRSLLLDTFNQTIKSLQSNSEDTPDIPLSNSEIKNESIFIIPFLIDFYTFSVTVDTKKGGNVSPLSLLSEQDLCDLVDSFLALNISNDNIEDLKNLLSGVTNAEHTKCS